MRDHEKSAFNYYTNHLKCTVFRIGDLASGLGILAARQHDFFLQRNTTGVNVISFKAVTACTQKLTGVLI
jgi:hypothetical protein